MIRTIKSRKTIGTKMCFHRNDDGKYWINLTLEASMKWLPQCRYFRWKIFLYFQRCSVVLFHKVSIDKRQSHYDDVIMSPMAFQITSLTIVFSTVYSGTDESKHQSSALLAFVRWIHRWTVNSPHKWPVTRKLFPLDDVIVALSKLNS